VFSKAQLPRNEKKRGKTSKKDRSSTVPGAAGPSFAKVL